MKLFNSRKGKLGGREKRMVSVLIFLGKLIILSLPMYAVLHFSISLYPLQEAVIGQSMAIFDASGYSPERRGFVITVNKTHEFSFAITEDCTPWKSIWLLFALMLAVKRRWKDRAWGFAAGAVLLWASNLLRIFLIVWTEQHLGLGAAMFIHNYLWKALLVGVVVAFWALWISRTGKNM